MTLFRILFLLIAGSVIYSLAANAETTVYFEDGSVAYTDDPVYTSPTPLYGSRTLSDGVIKFTPATPLVGGSVAEDAPEEPVGDLQCWPWAGVAAPAGFSTSACVVEETPEECTPNGLTFGGSC
jgi:hypothetical protein